MDEYSKQEIAQLKRIIADLQHQVEYDEVTGLLNSRGLTKQAQPLLQQSSPGEYALLYFDVLRFKAINDMFGMGEGDKLLRHIAHILQLMQQQGELVCRWGADAGPS